MALQKVLKCDAVINIKGSMQNRKMTLQKKQDPLVSVGDGIGHPQPVEENSPSSSFRQALEQQRLDDMLSLKLSKFQWDQFTSILLDRSPLQLLLRKQSVERMNVEYEDQKNLQNEDEQQESEKNQDQLNDQNQSSLNKRKLIKKGEKNKSGSSLSFSRTDMSVKEKKRSPIRTERNVQKIPHRIAKNILIKITSEISGDKEFIDNFRKRIDQFQKYFNKRVYFVLMLLMAGLIEREQSLLELFLIQLEKVIIQKKRQKQGLKSQACQQAYHLDRMVKEIDFYKQACEKFVKGSKENSNNVYKALRIVYQRNQQKIVKIKEFNEAIDLINKKFGLKLPLLTKAQYPDSPNHQC